MASPEPNRKYSYEDYLSWPDEERWEILDGTAYMQAAPSRIHQEISGELHRQFANYLQGKSCKVYHAPFCVRLYAEKKVNESENVVEPDITVVCDKTKLDEKGCNGSPDLIIEISSPSTGKIDKILKFNIYERAGVSEYWIVEPVDTTVTVYTLGNNKRYERKGAYSEEDQISASVFPDLTVELKRVFEGT